MTEIEIPHISFKRNVQDAFNFNDFLNTPDVEKIMNRGQLANAEQLGEAYEMLLSINRMKKKITANGVYKSNIPIYGETSPIKFTVNKNNAMHEEEYSPEIGKTTITPKRLSALIAIVTIKRLETTKEDEVITLLGNVINPICEPFMPKWCTANSYNKLKGMLYFGFVPGSDFLAVEYWTIALGVAKIRMLNPEHTGVSNGLRLSHKNAMNEAEIEAYAMNRLGVQRIENTATVAEVLQTPKGQKYAKSLLLFVNAHYSNLTPKDSKVNESNKLIVSVMKQLEGHSFGNSSKRTVPKSTTRGRVLQNQFGNDVNFEKISDLQDDDDDDDEEEEEQFKVPTRYKNINFVRDQDSILSPGDVLSSVLNTNVGDSVPSTSKGKGGKKKPNSGAD